MQGRFLAVLILLGVICVTGLKMTFAQKTPEDYWELKEGIVAQFGNKAPRFWGEAVPGVKRMLDTEDTVIALTFDACGSKESGYDKDLFDYLKKKKIPATLFINSRWIDKNPGIFKQLAANPLFEIENHGVEHKSCSVNGNSVYGVEGTRNSAEVVDEVELNARKIGILTGRKPRFYRSGTAYYDEIAVQVVQSLGYEAVGFSVHADWAGAYPSEKVRDALLGAPSGAIVFMYMDRPQRKETLEGLAAAVPTLKARGFRFVRLADYKLK